MKRIFKALIFVLFGMISFTGLMFGCAGNYDNVKVTSDRDETGLKLYIGEDTEGDVRSVGTITFYVENLENGAENLKFNFEGYEESRIVKITEKKVTGNSVTITVQAISGGSTKIVALTEVGMKYDSVQVDCIKRLESFEFMDTYAPAMFNVPQSKLTLDTKKIIFEPSDTTQNQVVYSIEPQVDGASIINGGVLTLSKKVAGDITVVARSSDNQNNFDTILVHLIEPIETEDGDGIEINSLSNLYRDGQITLASDGDDSFIAFRVDVNTSEKITYDYKLESTSDDASTNANCVSVEHNNAEFIVRSEDVGECKLVLYISFSDYDAPIIKKEIAIKVVQLPKTVTVNGQTEDFSENIYTYYDDARGKRYTVEIGDFKAYNKTYMIAVSDQSFVSICKDDGSPITTAQISDGKLTVEGEFLRSGQSIFVKGLQANKNAKLYVIAYGTVNFKTLLVREINLNIMLGSENVEPEMRTLDGEPSPIYYLEIGKSFELDYSIDQNSSAYGIQLVQSDGSALDGIISTEISTGIKPTILVNGLDVGEISCKLLLDNLVESNSFIIKVFKQVEYIDDEQTGGVYFSVDSPLENPNIAQVEYVYQNSFKTLDSFVLSLGKTVKLKHSVNPSDATIYSISYSTVINREGQQFSATEYLYVSESGNVTARKILPETVVIDEVAVNQRLAIIVQIESLTTDEYGDVVKVISTKTIDVDIYLPISDVKISKQSSTIYWNDGKTLNPVQVDGGAYKDTIDLTVYSDAINLSKVHVNWNCPNELSFASNNNGLSATVSAFNMPENAPEKSIYTVTATVQYYSTIIVKRCTFTVINATRASYITASVDDIERNVAYFEIDNNNSISPDSIQINSAVYSATGKQDVTFDKVYYLSRNENVATVDSNGLIKPVGAGKTEIWVYAEDMMPRLSGIGDYRIINVIVANGASRDSALRIRSELDFEKIENNPNLYYYFSSDINLTRQHYISQFSGQIEGNEFSLTGLMLNEDYPSLFGEIMPNAMIRDLNISASYNISATEDISITGLAQTNNGFIQNVSVYFVSSTVSVENSDISITISGIAINNNNRIISSNVSANFEVISENPNNLTELNIGGLVAYNNTNAIVFGTNENYEYRPLSSVQTYDFSGTIKVSENLTITNSAIGGIFAINNSNVNSNPGFATNVVIDAISTNNVGGIVGINNGSIQNVLVVANITAQNNVGGIAGYSSKIINNAIVEMYKSISNDLVFGKIEGIENIGGIVGLLNGTEDENANLTYSYVYAYAEGSFVGGTNNVGGIVGSAQYAELEKVYANTTISNSQIAGGLVGYADNVTVTNAYSIVKNFESITFGSAFGNVDSDVVVENFYSTFNGGMIGNGSVESQNCYTTDLTNINTFENWSISDSSLYDDQNNRYFDWFISSAENGGYPSLIYDGFLMRKLQPTQINIKINTAFDQNKANDVIILGINQLYSISDILQITTDVTSKANIYVYSSVIGVLNTKNTTNLLSNRATLVSSTEQVVTLTFVLGNNPTIQQQIQVAFINVVESLKIDDIDLKINQTVSLSALINGAVLNGSSNFKLGVANSVTGYISFSNADTLSVSGITIFDGSSKITGIGAFDSNNVNVNLYYRLSYEDLNGEQQVAYYLVTSTSAKLKVYAGATNINISNTSIDMTLIDAVTFTVTLDTDKSSDKIIIKNQPNSQIEYVGTSDYVSSYQANSVSDSAKIQLSVITDNGGVYDGKLTVTFELKFKDEYLDANNNAFKFSKMFTENLEFYAESNNEISKSIKITAQPQNLLKIDLTNYPSGQKIGQEFDLQNKTPSNTLTPGQMGMIIADIYPNYAYFDEIELSSSVTSNGKAIHFIQVAKDENQKYIEIRPNLNTIENGIILRSYSTVTFDEDNQPIYKFDGRFYVNTIISSNVEKEEIIIVTATGITNITNESGVVIQVRQIIKTIEITVKPAPELKLSQFESEKDEYNTDIPVSVTNSGITETKYYNLIYIDQTINFNIEQKYGMQVSNIAVSAKSGNQNVITDTSKVSTANQSTFSVTATLINGTLKAGDIITVQVTGTKIINGFLEEYRSEALTYLVVDYVINGIKVLDTTDGSMSFVVNQPKMLTANIIFKNSTGQITEEINNINDTINTQYVNSYWSSIVDRSFAWNLSFDADTSKDRIATNSYDNAYIVYKNWPVGDEYPSYYGILATNKPDYTPKFEVGLKYYYKLVDGELELVIGSKNTADGIGHEINDIVSMNIKIESNLDKPVTIYTIEDFYSMTTGTDYILMNDLWFGYDSSPATDVTSDMFASDYTPFDLTANSFDGNMHKIHINGNCMNVIGNGSANFALFTSIASGSIFKNIDIVYEDEFIVDGENLTASSIYFSGVVIRNSGVISNVYVYYNGDVKVDTNSADGEVYIAGFAYYNYGKITYSAVYGQDLNDVLKNNEIPIKDDEIDIGGLSFKNTQFASSRVGNIAGFVGANTDLISNCEVEFVGISNTAPASRNAKISGFAISNSGEIYNSSTAGQRVASSYDNWILPIFKNDSRIVSESTDDLYFARLESNGNIAGFVYTNSGSIENAYAIHPMETQSKTAGFVYDNSNDGSVIASYTASFYDGSNTNNSAYAPFVGRNQYGQVLNDSKTSVVRYCYYLLSDEENYEEDILFKEPASRISIDLSESETSSVATEVSSYIGFDISAYDYSIWNAGKTYALPTLNSNQNNKSIRDDFERKHITRETNVGTIEIYFERSSGDAPYQIADALQFVNAFNEESIEFSDGTYYFDKNIRLINDIDLSDYAGTEILNKIRKVVFNGDFDGNGMTISGLKLLGDSENISNTTENSNPYLYSTSSYGLFNQIGTATKKVGDIYTYNNFGYDESNTIESTAKIRNLTLKVDEVSKSNSAFTGILAGVIVNTDIKSLKIQSSNIYVLGKYAVGGVAGGIFGKSTLYNISINANVTSSYQQYRAETYRDKNIESFSYSEENPNGNYKFIDYSDSEIVDKIDFAKGLNRSYSGGVAGIVDIYLPQAILAEALYKDDNYKNLSSNLNADLPPNISVITVNGSASITGEIVGGLFGTTSEDAYIAYASYEVSKSGTQQIQGYYTAGGLVGISNGSLIRYSKVEVSQEYVDSDDNDLTNSTGNNLFNTQTYPFAIGGLVGIQRGGYLITSYSKTNVINQRAHYAGGLVGYLTDYESIFTGTKVIDNEGIEEEIEIKYLKNGRFVLFEEVYTTGNVFAGDDFQIEDGVATPTSYVGGIVGCYKPFKIENLEGNAVNNDAFNGVMGINAFHMPNNYTVPTTYKVQGTSNNPTYSQIVTGYTGQRTKADGSVEIVEFKSRIGSIFGEIISDFDVTFQKSQTLYNNLYINFVYNNTTIKTTDCSSSNGSNITANYAKISSGKTFSTNGINTFSYIDGATQITVKLNSSDADTTTEKHIKNSNVYLALRGQGTQTYYRQNKNPGIYNNWNDNWLFQSPIYPKFKPKNLVEYIEIHDEAGLKAMRSGNKYKIVNDIYLQNDWASNFDLSYITLTSEKRNDGKGIVIDGTKSTYYAIYNINLIDSSQTYSSYGFINSLRYSTIKNITFVYGTQIGPNPEEDYYEGSCQGCSVSSRSANFGLLVGKLNSTEISNCNVVLNKDATYKIQKDNEQNDSAKNIGIISGYADSSAISLTKIVSGTLNASTKVVTRSEATITFDGNKAENIAFGVGNSSNTTINLDIQQLSYEITGINTNSNVSIGGVAGKFVFNSKVSENISGKIADVKFDIKGIQNQNQGSSNTYFGGVAGYAECVSTTNNQFEVGNISIKVGEQNNKFDNVKIGGLFGEFSSSVAKEITVPTIEIELSNATTQNSFVGGLIGNSSSSTIENVNVDEISISNTSSYTGENCVAGIIGNNYDSTVTDTEISKTTINENSQTVSGQAYIGGAFGKLNLNKGTEDTGIKINNLQINCTTEADKLYLAGFVGGIVNGSTGTISNSYASGAINQTGSSAETSKYISGFASSGILGSVNDLNKTQIQSCVSDVEIKFAENGANVFVAGFAVAGFNKITDSASIGDIIFVNNLEYSKTLFTGKASGFTCQSSGTISNCFSLSTLKLIGNGANVKATSFGIGGISFNYNLSGVFDLSVKNSSKTYKDLIDAYNSKLSSIYSTDVKGKLNATENQDITYYIIGENSYVANDSKTQTIAPEISDFSSVEFISGFTFNAPIATNNGYIFNCAMVGESGYTTTGFISQNNGIINACGTNAIIDVDNANVDVVGFVLTNKGIISNSYATNIYKNQTTASSVSGFVNNNEDGYIFNCYASPAMFDITNNTNYSNRNLFAPNTQNLSNCYSDSQTQTTSGSSKTYSKMVEQSGDMFGITPNDTQNYGYATPFTFTGAHGVGQLGTGGNTSSYIINNFGRFAYLIGKNPSNFYAKFVIDIDARQYGAVDGITSGYISVNNNNDENEILSIYGLKLSSGSTGLFSADYITLTNFGIVGTMGSSDISTNKGFLVGETQSLTTSNCYAILDQEIVINSGVSFGVLAGKVTGSATINNTFAYANKITVNSDNANVGVMIGESFTTTIASSYVAGIMVIAKENANVGGFAGSASISTNNNNSYVVLQNKTNKLSTELKLSPFVGADKSLNCSYNTYLSLYGDSTDVYTGASIGNFANNSIISSKLLTDGSLLNPIELTDQTDVSDKFYYINSDFALSNSISANPKMIVGNGKTVTISGGNALLSNSSSTVVSGLTIANSPFASGTYGGYAFKVTTTGAINSSYGFVDEIDYDAVFDECSSLGTISSSQNKVSGFANTFRSSKFRKTNIDVTLKSSASSGDYYFSGVFNTSNSTSISVNLESIKISVSGTYSGNCYVGGLSGQFTFASNGFGKVSAVKSIINQIEFAGINTSGDCYIGGLFGYAYAYAEWVSGILPATADLIVENTKITNLIVSGEIYSKNCYFGGIVGYTENQSSTYATASVKIDTTEIGQLSISGKITSPNNDEITSSNKYIGGLVGQLGKGDKVINSKLSGMFQIHNDYEISSDTTQSNISATGNNYIGGLVGYVLERDSSTDIASIKDSQVGAFAIHFKYSYTQNYVSNSQYYNITGKNNYIGGIAGYLGANITIDNVIMGNAFTRIFSEQSNINATENNVTKSNIKATSENHIGYFVGRSEGKITNATYITDSIYAFTLSGAITGTTNYIGGAVGSLPGGDISTKTKAFEITGQITGTTNYIGGIVGIVNGGTITSSQIGTFTISGAVTGTTNYIGGVSGHVAESGNVVSSNISEFKLSGAITGIEYNNIGGIAGRNDASITDSKITTFNITREARIEATSDDTSKKKVNYIGGLVGVLNHSIGGTSIVETGLSIENFNIAGKFTGYNNYFGGIAAYSYVGGNYATIVNFQIATDTYYKDTDNEIKVNGYGIHVYSTNDIYLGLIFGYLENDIKFDELDNDFVYYPAQFNGQDFNGVYQGLWVNDNDYGNWKRKQSSDSTYSKINDNIWITYFVAGNQINDTGNQPNSENYAVFNVRVGWSTADKDNINYPDYNKS